MPVDQQLLQNGFHFPDEPRLPNLSKGSVAANKKYADRNDNDKTDTPPEPPENEASRKV